VNRFNKFVKNYRLNKINSKWNKIYNNNTIIGNGDEEEINNGNNNRVCFCSRCSNNLPDEALEL